MELRFLFDYMLSSQYQVDFLLRRKRGCVGIAGGIRFEEYPSSAKESVNHFFSILGSGACIPSTDNLDFLISVRSIFGLFKNSSPDLVYSAK